MKLLMLLFNQTDRGTYWRAMGFARVLAQRGHCVTLVCTSPSTRLRKTEREVSGVHLVEMPDAMPGPLRYGWDPWNILQRLNWLRGKKFDIVHAFETRPVCIWPALVAQCYGAKLFLDWSDWFGRGGSVEERTSPFIRALVRHFDTFFENHYRTYANGTTVINSFLRRRAVDLGVISETIRLIRNGSDISVPPVDRLAARSSLGLAKTDQIIGFVGSTFDRDAHFMASAFNQVCRQNPNVKLLLVGYFNRSIEKYVQSPKSILRSGPVDYQKIYTFLSACDACWLPLNDSGANRGRWPFKLNDYMTVGRPVVATAVGDLAELIPQYDLGIVTPVDAHQFAEETLLLLRDEVRANAIGQNCRKVAQNVFNWERLTDELEAFYMASV